MSEIFFILKSFILTILIVIFMQVKVGETTIEEKTLLWIESSTIISPIQKIVDGGVKVVKETWKTAFGNLNSKFFNSVKPKNLPGKRDLNLVIERSEEYLRDRAKKTSKAIQESDSSSDIE
ncbi:MAG: hypothetical protein H6625_04905 [Bdellovibrionaceae bacterium]|nr:hypothetical protein [Pseudobdellovibrionaceae bacterium]